MKRIKKYRHLFYGETIGWRDGRRISRELTAQEYDELVSLLEHCKTRIRWSAADRLGKIENVLAIYPLVARLKDPHWLVRLHAAKALTRIGDRAAVKSFIDSTGDDCPFVRRRVLEGLLKLDGDVNTAPVFMAALSDPDAFVRRRALEALLRFSRDVDIAPVLVSALADPDAQVYWCARTALTCITARTPASLYPSLWLRCKWALLRARLTRA